MDANEEISTGEIMYVYFSLVMVQNGAKAQNPHSDNAQGRYWTAFMPITHYPNQGGTCFARGDLPPAGTPYYFSGKVRYLLLMHNVFENAAEPQSRHWGTANGAGHERRALMAVVTAEQSDPNRRPSDIAVMVVKT